MGPGLGQPATCGSADAGRIVPRVAEPSLNALYILASVPEINRRNIMITMGLGALGAAMSLPEAWAHPSPPTAPADAAPGSYIFHDEFDGPAGQGPDLAKWTPQTWQDDVFPPVDGIYRAGNVFLDGNSNLVLQASPRKRSILQRASCAVTGGARSTPPGKRGSNSTVCSPACGPRSGPSTRIRSRTARSTSSSGTATAHGLPGTTVHAASNGKTWEGKSIPGMVDDAWHTWRMRWDEDGFKFWRDYVDGAKPYFSVPPKPIHVFGAPPEDKRWPFSNPGYWLSPMFTLAVGGVGAGDPAAGTFPCQMLDRLHPRLVAVHRTALIT